MTQQTITTRALWEMTLLPPYYLFSLAIAKPYFPLASVWPAASPSQAPTIVHHSLCPCQPPSHLPVVPCLLPISLMWATSSWGHYHHGHHFARRTASSTTAPTGRWSSLCTSSDSSNPRTMASFSMVAGKKTIQSLTISGRLFHPLIYNDKWIKLSVTLCISYNGQRGQFL